MNRGDPYQKLAFQSTHLKFQLLERLALKTPQCTKKSNFRSSICTPRITLNVKLRHFARAFLSSPKSYSVPFRKLNYMLKNKNDFLKFTLRVMCVRVYGPPLSLAMRQRVLISAAV